MPRRCHPAVGGHQGVGAGRVQAHRRRIDVLPRKPRRRRVRRVPARSGRADVPQTRLNQERTMSFTYRIDTTLSYDDAIATPKAAWRITTRRASVPLTV